MKNYLEYIQSKKYFDFIQKDLKLKNALNLFSAYVFYLYKSLDNIENDDFLIEFKKHTIEIYMGAIVEAIIYYFVKEKLENNQKAKRKYLELEELKIYQKIKNTDLIICKLEKKEITLNDSINFKGLIDGLKDKKIIDNKIIEKIDGFRKARNSIHINVYKNGEQIFNDLIKLFKDFKDILTFVKKNLAN